MNDSFTVYCHVNKTNGKKYIGITSVKPEKRWGCRGDGYYGQPFYKAIKKYGWDGFEHIILYKNLSEEDAKAKEIELIAQYETTDSEKGYNATIGGESANGLIHSEDTKKRISKALKGRQSPNKGRVHPRNPAEPFYWTGRKHTEETKAKMRASYKYHFTEETIKKMSESKKGKRTGKNSNRAHAVICLDTGERFDTISDAELKTGVRSSHISMVCSGKRKTAGRMRWAYAV